MTDTELLKVIDDFIRKRVYNYAIMIDGSWGSGKTYFVDHTLIPHLQKQGIDVNYISLFGIKSVDEISSMLCVQAIKDKIPMNLESKAGRVAETAINSLLRFGIAKIGAQEAQLENLLEELPNYNNNVIVFDDLERCGCNIELVLGYINNFVEHSQARVLLIANESEIGRWQLDSNQELQMLLALDKRLAVNTEDTKEEIIQKAFGNTQNKEGDEQFSLEKLNLRRNAIFNRNNQYLRIKEKVIGKTITYEPDLLSIFTRLVDDNIQNDIIKEIIKDEVEELIEYSEQEKHNNIRTFQFFIEKLNAIFDLIGQEYAELHETLIKYCYRSCVRMMSGHPLPDWGSNEFGFQLFDKNPFSMNQIMGFRFIDNFIKYGTLNNSETISSLNRYCQKQLEEGKLKNDPYHYIQRWYESEVQSPVKQRASPERTARLSGTNGV